MVNIGEGIPLFYICTLNHPTHEKNIHTRKGLKRDKTAENHPKNYNRTMILKIFILKLNHWNMKNKRLHKFFERSSNLDREIFKYLNC